MAVIYASSMEANTQQHNPFSCPRCTKIRNRLGVFAGISYHCTFSAFDTLVKSQDSGDRVSLLPHRYALKGLDHGLRAKLANTFSGNITLLQSNAYEDWAFWITSLDTGRLLQKLLRSRVYSQNLRRLFLCGMLERAYRHWLCYRTKKPFSRWPRGILSTPGRPSNDIHKKPTSGNERATGNPECPDHLTSRDVLRYH